MDNIHLRINKIIEDKKIKKIDFAETLGISSPSVTNLCNGKNNPSNQTIKMICSRYSINEEWLRTGNGDMYVPLTRNKKILSYVNEICNDDSRESEKQILSKMADIPIEHWDVLLDIVRKLAEE